MFRHRVVYAACAISLLLGLLFTFVWAPHPWGWEGFDHYHDRAVALTQGQSYGTMDVPWGYAYFLAAFYRMFGNRPWIPLLAQVVLNASIPLMVFAIARSWHDEQTAAVAAVITGIFSFNTVYASTQSSDAMCTWLFIAAVWAFIIARERDAAPWFGLAGLLIGIASQFRPNLILVPGVLAAYAAFEQPTRRRVVQAVVLVACAGVALLPWIVRNFRLTGLVLPTSVHAGVQLWYGTLQAGPYLHSRAYNPRSLFEAPVFDYTRLERAPIAVEGQVGCEGGPRARVSLAYWFGDDPVERRIPPAAVDHRRYTFEVPAPGRTTVVYYYFATVWPPHLEHALSATPPLGPRAPFVYFVSRDHLGDLDLHGDLLDLFDVARLARHEAWGEPLPFADRLRNAGMSGTREAIVRLLRPRLKERAGDSVVHVGWDAGKARIAMTDGSSITIPRKWRGSVTELTVSDGIAASLITARLSLKELADPAPARPVPFDAACTEVQNIAVNQQFYRAEPHMMRRYLALALDNIRQDPMAFAAASAYRAVRLFMIQGTADRFTAQQFPHSGRIYAAGTGISIIYLTLFAAGVVHARRCRRHITLPLVLIAYLPLTLAPMLTNMRYAMTVQPLMFIFVAVVIVAAANRWSGGQRVRAGSGRAGARTAHPS